jgi:hypothetical protein
MTPEEAREFLIKDSITVEGITEDFVWYHANLLEQKMRHWELDLQKLVRVMESRHKEHLQMVASLTMENKMLRSQLKEQRDAKGTN